MNNNSSYSNLPKKVNPDGSIANARGGNKVESEYEDVIIKNNTRNPPNKMNPNMRSTRDNQESLRSHEEIQQSTINKLMTQNFFNLIPLVTKDKNENTSQPKNFYLKDEKSSIEFNETQKIHLYDDHSLDMSPIKNSSVKSSMNNMTNLFETPNTRYANISPQVKSGYNNSQQQRSMHYDIKSHTPPGQKGWTQDVLFKPPVKAKKGEFSQPKTKNQIYKKVKFNSQPNMTVKNNKNFDTSIKNADQTVILKNNTDLHRISRSPSTTNLIHKKNIEMENDSNHNNSILNRNESATSINFSKYKIANNHNNEYPNSPTPGFIQLKKLLTEKSEANSPKEIFQTFNNQDRIVKNNAIVNSYNFQEITTMPSYEFESRKMITELLKVKLRHDPKMSLAKVLEKFKINKNILKKPTNISHKFSTAPNSTNILSVVKNHNDLGSNVKHAQSMIRTGSSQLKTYANNNKNSLEIKNNKFEINNNYYGTINLPGADNSNISINQFLYNMDEDSHEKLNLVNFLITPRVLYMNINSINSTNKVPFLFQLSPTSLCHVYGFEHYIFQWNELNTFNQVNINLILGRGCRCSKNSIMFYQI
jgi:hypothetical protein